jgi:hypothetical protein
LAESANDPAALFHAMPHIFANASFYLGLALGWLALRPLLMLIGLDALAEAFTWLLLATVIAGSVRLSAIIYRLTAARGVACAAIPILGVALPVLYRLGAVRVWPTLWPADNAALWLAFVAFAVVSMGFLHQTALIVVHGSARIAQRLRQNGHVIALVYLETVTLAIVLIWFAVALE